MYASFLRLTILSALVSVYYIFDMPFLCINFDTHPIEHVKYLLTVINVSNCIITLLTVQSELQYYNDNLSSALVLHIDSLHD